MLNFFLGLLFFTDFFNLQDTSTVVAESPHFSTLVQHQTLTVHPDFTYTHVDERRILVTSPDGMDHTFSRLPYDKLNEVKSFELEVVDLATGKTLKKAKLRDMGDAAYYSSSSVFDDNRYKYFEVTTPKYPIEVKIRSEVYSKTNFFLPNWIPVLEYNQKVTESSFTVHYPTSMGLNFKEINLSGNRSEKELAGITTITWSESDLAVQARDFKSEDDLKLMLAPVQFALDQYPGEMKDWSGLASWQYELNKGRDVLPGDFATKVLSLVEGIEDPYEKVKILYGYLQENYRYVSIQLGIGGWQTMTAEDVVKYSYGDCKGLTNLMKAMLDLVGIPSNYTLVYAGPDAKDIEVDLPSNQFNHVILQVPTDAQPIWLECTSTLLPAGYLGDFTKNRHVLVTHEGGGYLTKTPAYNAEHWNLIRSQSKVVVDAQGNARINTKQQFLGNFAEEMLYVKSKLDERQQRDYLNRNSAVSGLIVEDYRIEVTNQDSVPVSEITFEGYLQKFSQATAKRIILRPFLGKLGPDHLANKALNQVDEYEIELPKAWRPEGNLPSVVINEENFKGSLEITMEGKSLRVRRELTLKIPENLEKDSETEILRKINNSFDRTVFFSSTNLTTSTNLSYE